MDEVSAMESHANGEEAGEQQLCLCCIAPNEPDSHFCVKCGAPLTSYAATGPIESIYAEGYACRQAVEKPRSFIVVLGIWCVFAPAALMGVSILSSLRDWQWKEIAMGLCYTVVPIIIIWKTTRRYMMREIPHAEHDADVDP